jgi:hypothetical protein
LGLLDFVNCLPPFVLPAFQCQEQEVKMKSMPMLDWLKLMASINDLGLTWANLVCRDLIVTIGAGFKMCPHGM